MLPTYPYRLPHHECVPSTTGSAARSQSPRGSPSDRGSPGGDAGEEPNPFAGDGSTGALLFSELTDEVSLVTSSELLLYLCVLRASATHSESALPT
eukprot:SAG22_NODE_495_length_9802_cov_111.077605_8_plen_96_part_00